MALAPADFYAYSRATGVPVPEDPEERAAMAPDVLAFRRNQLKAPEPESNPLATVGAVAAGLGALAGGAYAARRLLGKPQAKPVVPPSKLATTTQNLTPEGRANISSVARQQAAEQTERQLRQERPQGVVQTDLGYVDDILNDPGLRSQVEYEEFTRNLTGTELSDLRSAESKSRGEYRGLVTEIGDQIIAQERAKVQSQTLGALESGEDQMTGRVKMQLSRNEDLDLSQIETLENIAEENNALMQEHADPSQMQGYIPDQAINQAVSQLPDGPPLDQAEGKRVFDLSGGKSKITGNIVTQGSKQYFTAFPNVLNQGQTDDALIQEAIRHLRAQEIDTDFDYSLENKIQAAQVNDRIQRAQALQNQANQILSEIQAKTQPATQQLSPEEFASTFNKQYREELNASLQLVDNARQRAEQRAAQTGATGEDLESLLLGEPGTVETTMQGKALRGGKPNITGDIVYQDDAGNFVTADAGLKTRLNQGQQYEQRARRLNQLRSASDEELTGLFFQGQQAIANKQPMTQLDLDTIKFASEILRTRALKEVEPTRLQLDALERSKASIAKSQEILQTGRNLRPTVSPGPAQDVARSMETLRRAMIVDPSEPLPSYPSVQQLRTGFIDAGDYAELGPILGASDVYTGAAAEAAGPVIFTGKSKANTVIKQPDITGSVTTPVGKYLTQDNPDVLGTVYKVAGTPANRAIAAQVEANAQAFLADALTGDLQQKTQRAAEPYRTPGTYGVQQLNLLTPPLSEKGFSQNPLGLTGPAPSQRTLYAQYQPGRSGQTPVSPFIGEMSGGTVNVVPPSTAGAAMRRDIGAPSGSIDLTRRGERGRYFSRYPEQPFVTGMEPAPIGPIVPSPGLSRVGKVTQQTIKGAGNLPITQLTTQGQRISYPRMDPLVKAEGFRGEQITNVPRYGINPGAEDWRTDLMRSEFRRSGPLRRYQA